MTKKTKTAVSTMSSKYSRKKFLFLFCISPNTYNKTAVKAIIARPIPGGDISVSELPVQRYKIRLQSRCK
jgi:hypothetical protein